MRVAFVACLGVASLFAVPAHAQDRRIADFEAMRVATLRSGIDRCRRTILRLGNAFYPKAAKAQQIYGSVQLTTTVSDTGQILDVRVDRSSGSPILDEAAADFIRTAAPCRIMDSSTTFTRTFVFQKTESGEVFHDHDEVFSDPARYVAALRRRIHVGTFKGLPRDTKVVVELTINPAGEVEDARLREPSGFVPYDDEILRAVRAAQPYPVMAEWLRKGAPEKVNLVIRVPEQ